MGPDFERESRGEETLRERARSAASGSWKYSTRRASAERRDEEETKKVLLRKYLSQRDAPCQLAAGGLRAAVCRPRSTLAAMFTFEEIFSVPTKSTNDRQCASSSGSSGPKNVFHRDAERVLRIRDLRPDRLAAVVVLDVLPAVQEPELARPVVVEARRDLEAGLVVRRELAHPPARVVPVVLREEAFVSDVARLDPELEEDAAACVELVRDRRLVDVSPRCSGAAPPRGRRRSRSPRRPTTWKPTGFASSETSSAARFRPNWFAFCGRRARARLEVVPVGRPVRVPRRVDVDEAVELDRRTDGDACSCGGSVWPRAAAECRGRRAPRRGGARASRLSPRSRECFGRCGLSARSERARTPGQESPEEEF